MKTDNFTTTSNFSILESDFSSPYKVFFPSPMTLFSHSKPSSTLPLHQRMKVKINYFCLCLFDSQENNALFVISKFDKNWRRDEEGANKKTTNPFIQLLDFRQLTTTNQSVVMDEDELTFHLHAQWNHTEGILIKDKDALGGRKPSALKNVAESSFGSWKIYDLEKQTLKEKYNFLKFRLRKIITFKN